MIIMLIWQSLKRLSRKNTGKGIQAESFKEARKNGDEIDGLNDWNIRWVGPEGYQGIVARQLQDFKKAQKERSEEDA